MGGARTRAARRRDRSGGADGSARPRKAPRRARALVALHAADHEQAVALARRATEVADSREYINTRTHYWWGLARVLVAAGRDGEAREAIAETERLVDLKGSVVYANRIRGLADELNQLDPTH